MPLKYGLPLVTVKCKQCGRQTNRPYAAKHNGKCKRCVDPKGFAEEAAIKQRRLQRPI